MLTIGDFARHGRVSVRMPRHHDAIGLLRPDRADPGSGYRFYAAARLGTLNRVVALKDLGFTLRQIGAILDERIGADEPHGMLRPRRAERRAGGYPRELYLECPPGALDEWGTELQLPVEP